MEYRLKGLWMSNTPWCTSGYGIQTNYLLPRFRERGYLFDIFAFYGLQGGMLKWDGFMMYPIGRDSYGNDIVEAHYKHSRADLLITLLDVWVLDRFPEKVKRWVPYMPVDHEPVQRVVLDHIKGAWDVLPYAKFGQEQLTRAGVNSTYIPHGVEPTIYRPLDNRHQYKRLLGFEESDFVVGMVAANKGNPSRKNFDGQFRAFAEFAKRHPDARLYCHAEPTEMWQGVNLPELVENVAREVDLPDLSKRVHFCDRYENMLGFPAEYLARAYNAFDAFLMCTYGEGYGLPTCESQACGCPVVGSDNTATSELIQVGYKVRMAEKWYTPLGSWQFIPDSRDIVTGLEWCYQRRYDEILRAQASKAMAPYHWDHIVDHYWVPWFEKSIARIREEEPHRVPVEGVPSRKVLEAESPSVTISEAPPPPQGYEAVETPNGYVMEKADEASPTNSNLE